MSDEEKRDDEAAGPPEEQEEKGLGLTEEFARLEEEIRREVSSEPEAAEEAPAAEEPAADAGPADLDDDAGPAAGEWTAPAAEAPGPEAPSGDTEEWALEGAAGEADGEPEPEGPAGQEGESDEEWVAAPEPVSEEAVSVGPPGAEEPPEDDVEHTVVRRGPPPVPIAASGYGEPEEDPEITTPALWWRFLMASVLIIVSISTAVAMTGILTLNGIASDIRQIPHADRVIDQIETGEPQTILIVGSDKRSNTPGDPGRSDTTMLLRVDPEQGVLSLFSLPRDLKVEIPGYGTGKLNEAFTVGGVTKTAETVKQLTNLDINHIVNVDFEGFAKAVDAIGCVYVDVDRHYFNDNSTALSDLETFAEINVNAGYQRLCGQNALDYVRYRHTDTDIVRSARQQDFLRNARAQVPVSEVLPIISGDTGSDLLDIFTKYTASDIKDSGQMVAVLKAFLGVRDVPINQISFDGTLGPSYVTATPGQIQKAVDEFLNGKDTPGPNGGKNATKPKDSGGDGSSGGSQPDKQKSESDPTDGANVIPTSDVLDPDTGINKFDAFGKTSARRLDFPVWVPTVVAPGSSYSEDSRQYDIKDEDDKKQAAYKLVIEYQEPDRLPEYYGVQGTTWSDPPILEKVSDTRTIDGRDFDLYYDGDRVRMVAWHDGDGNSYWVSNTLLQTLDESQMLAIAASTKEIK